MEALAESFNELRDLLQGRETELVIGVKGRIRWPSSYAWNHISTDVGGSDKIIDIYPADDEACLDFSAMVWPGYGDGDSKNSQMGITVRNRQFRIHGLRLEGFDVDGTVINLSSHNVEVFLVSGCTFVRCGTRIYEPRGGWDAWQSEQHASVGGYYVSGAQHQAHVNTLAGHNMTGCLIQVEGCTFQDCCLQAFDWAHCIYCSAERGVFSLRNRFHRCGNPYACGRPDSPIVLINGDLVDHPALCLDRYRGFRRAYVTKADAPGYRFIGNRVLGATSQMHNTHFSFAGEGVTFEANDYSGCWLENNYMDLETWCRDADQSQYRTQAEWITAGFDVHSVPMPED